MSTLSVLVAAQGAQSLAGAYSQSQALQAEGAASKTLANANARFSDLAADDAVIRGEKEAVRIKRDTKRLIGSQRVALAAQGIDVGSGSALDVQEDTAAFGATDAETARNNAWREAMGYKVQAADQRFRGDFAERSSRSAARSTLLTGGLQAINYGAQAYYLRNK